MDNSFINTELEKFIVNNNVELIVDRGDLSGYSINITDKHTKEDLGSYLYYNRYDDFIHDWVLLNNILK